MFTVSRDTQSLVCHEAERRDFVADRSERLLRAYSTAGSRFSEGVRDRSIRFALASLLVAASACVPSPAPEPQPRHGQPSAPDLPPSPEPDPAESSGPGQPGACELEVRTSFEPVSNGRFELVAHVRNTKGSALSFTVNGRCPGGPVRFHGLTASYDFGALCSQGACAGGPRTSEAFSLTAGAETELARVTVDPAGDACNPALPQGRYTVSASIEVNGASSCSAASAVLTASGRAAPHELAPELPVKQAPSVESPRTKRENCPAMGCAYVPCPPGVAPPTGCAAICGCAGMPQQPALRVAPH